MYNDFAAIEVTIVDKENEESQSQFVKGLWETVNVEVFFEELGPDGKMDFQDLLNLFHDSYTSVDYAVTVHNMDASRSNYHYKI